MDKQLHVMIKANDDTVKKCNVGVKKELCPDWFVVALVSRCIALMMTLSCTTALTCLLLQSCIDLTKLDFLLCFVIG